MLQGPLDSKDPQEVPINRQNRESIKQKNSVNGALGPKYGPWGPNRAQLGPMGQAHGPLAGPMPSRGKTSFGKLVLGAGDFLISADFKISRMFCHFSGCFAQNILTWSKN